jgi:hypothetical protein
MLVLSPVSQTHAHEDYVNTCRSLESACNSDAKFCIDSPEHIAPTIHQIRKREEASPICKNQSTHRYQFASNTILCTRDSLEDW